MTGTICKVIGFEKKGATRQVQGRQSIVNGGGTQVVFEIAMLTSSASTITSQGRKFEIELGRKHTFCSLSVNILTKCARSEARHRMCNDGKSEVKL